MYDLAGRVSKFILSNTRCYWLSRIFCSFELKLKAKNTCSNDFVIAYCILCEKQWFIVRTNAHTNNDEETRLLFYQNLKAEELIFLFLVFPLRHVFSLSQKKKWGTRTQQRNSKLTTEATAFATATATSRSNSKTEYEKTGCYTLKKEREKEKRQK